MNCISLAVSVAELRQRRSSGMSTKNMKKRTCQTCGSKRLIRVDLPAICSSCRGAELREIKRWGHTKAKE